MTKMIGAELLRSFSAGIALADPRSGLITFANPSFGSWFSTKGKGDALADVLPGLAEAAVDLGEYDAINFEARVRRRRRELVIEVTVRRTVDEGRDVLVLECQNISRLRETEAMINTYATLSEKRVRELEADKARIEKRATDLKSRHDRGAIDESAAPIPMLFEPVTALAFDFVDLNKRIYTANPTMIVAELEEIFSRLEDIAEVHESVRIKTLGDTFVMVAGLPYPDPDHALNAARCAVAMMRYIESLNERRSPPCRARIAIATGAAIGSIQGPQKKVFDVFGGALEDAVQLKSACAPMEILVSEALVDAMMDDFALSPSRTVPLATRSEGLRVAALDYQVANPPLRQF